MGRRIQREFSDSSGERIRVVFRCLFHLQEHLVDSNMSKFFLLALLTFQVTGTPVPKLEVGGPFPNFQLTDIATGELVEPRDHFRKKTILHVFASW